MRAELLNSVRLAACTIVLCAVAYPLTVLGVAALVAPEARMGSLIANDRGQVIGSRLVAQGFSRPDYFWPRPSAADFDASAAGGSNLSPANPAIRERAEAILLRLALPAKTRAPADLVTASGAGLDPHISYEGALVQAARVAASRGVGENEVVQTIDQVAAAIPLMTDEVRIVNVLELNLALDARFEGAP